MHTIEDNKLNVSTPFDICITDLVLLFRACFLTIRSSTDSLNQRDLMRWYTSYKRSVLVPSGWRRQRCEQTDSARDDRLIRGGALVGVVYRAGPAITIGTAAGASPKDGRQSRSHPRMVVKVVEATVNYCSRHTLLDLLLPWLECIASVKCTSKCRGCVGVCGGLVNYKFAFVRDSATVWVVTPLLPPTYNAALQL